MIHNIHNISEAEFNQIPAIRQIIVHQYARRFACLDLGENLGYYGLSWRTQSLELSVEHSTDRKLLWIGIDEQLAAINLENGRINFAMPLTASLIQMKVIREVTAVLTENEILLFNPNGSLRFNHGLPDLPEQFLTLDEGAIVIKLMGSESFSLNTQTGSFQQLTEELVNDIIKAGKIPAPQELLEMYNQ